MQILERNRLRTALERANMTMKAASLAAGVGETYVRDVLERGKDPTISKLSRVCDVLGISIAEILYEDGDNGTIPVVGYVGAGALIYNFEGQVTEGELDRIDAPPDSGPNTVAVKVRGESMPGEADEDSILVYDERLDPPDPSLVGRLCVVWCEDGRVLVKRLGFGSQPGLWSLVSTGGHVERDVALKAAARVKWIQPP